MKKSNMIFAIIIGLFIFYVGNRCGDIWFQSVQGNVLDKFIEVSESIDGFFSDFKIAFDSKSLACGGLSLFFYFLAVLLIVSNRKNTMPGKEYGSA